MSLRRIPLVLAAATWFAASPVVHAQLVRIAWDESGRAAHDISVAPRRFAELCGQLERGSVVQWSFKSDRPLDFNVHFHEGRQIVYPSRQDGASTAEGRLDVAVAQDYCWMWTNAASEPAVLKVELRR